MMSEGKIALVTGAASGIGLAIAKAFAKEGARVALADRHESQADNAANSIRAAGGEAIAIAADVTSEASVSAMIESVVRAYGGLDCAVNNAGIGGRETGTSGRKAGEIPLEAWNAILAVNLTGVWLCMRRELEVLQARGGSIVNIASIGGLIGLPTAAAYTASKHGVVGLTKAAAVEYGRSRIRVNAVCPGYIETPLIQSGLDERRKRLEARTALGRLGEPAEIAELVVWLSSDRASYVTGAAYAADGGYIAG